MTKFQKRQTSITPEVSDNLLTPIAIPEVTETPIDEPDFSAATAQALLDTVKARNTRALDELQQQMDDLRDDFVNQSVAIVEAGFKDCFFRASQRIRHLQIDWTTTDGHKLGTTLETIALPSATTEGVTE